MSRPRAREILGQLLAFVIPPLILGSALTFRSVSVAMKERQQSPFPLPSPAPLSVSGPAAQDARPLALIVLGDSGTQITDLMMAVQVLGESGAFRVATAAPQRELLATTAQLGVVPDYVFADAPQADLLVLPGMIVAEPERLEAWVRAQAARARFTLTLSEGAAIAAQAGLLKNRNATSHFRALPALARLEPAARWTRDQAWVADGNVISSPGVAASAPALLVAVERFAGANAARRTAERLGFAWPASSALLPERGGAPLADQIQLYLRGGYDWNKKEISVGLADGFEEIPAAALLDTLPRTLSATSHSVAKERRILRSRHGLSVVASLDTASAPTPGVLIMLAPGSGAASDTNALRDWARSRGAALQSFNPKGAAHAFPESLRLISGSIASPVLSTLRHLARMLLIEITDETALAPSSASAGDRLFPLWMRPFYVGFLCLGLARLVQRRRRQALTGK